MQLYLRFLLEKRAIDLRLYEDAMATTYRMEAQGNDNPPHLRLAENALKRVEEYEAQIARLYPQFSGPWFEVGTKDTSGFRSAYTFIEVDHK